MTTAMPLLESEHLVIRPFTLDDLEFCHALYDVEAWQTGQSLAERRTWLEWSIFNYEALANLAQPPYGDRAIVLRSSGEVVGAVGLVPSMGAFDRLPSFGAHLDCDFIRPEFGLFWAVRPAYRQQGYATEAARAVVDFAFRALQVRRVIATTDYDNFASQAVMRHLGMSIERNPRPDPPYMQVVGVLQNPTAIED